MDVLCVSQRYQKQQLIIILAWLLHKTANPLHDLQVNLFKSFEGLLGLNGVEVKNTIISDSDLL